MKKYALGITVAGILGVGISHANNVLIPYIKAGGNWVSLVSYVTTCPDYPGNTPQPCDENLHFVYWYKNDWTGFEKIADFNVDATDGSYDDASCKEYNVEVPATENDFTTVDVSASNKLGLTNNVLGIAEGYDGGNFAPSSDSFVLEPDNVVDAYLLIQDSNTISVSALSLSAEAVVFDMVTGMFFYQYGIHVERTVDLSNAISLIGFDPSFSNVMFQGEDFATTSIYYIPMGEVNATDIAQGRIEAVSYLEGGNNEGCVLPLGDVFNRKEDSKSGTNIICVKCLALIPVQHFMSDATWNKVKSGGGVFTSLHTGGVAYKGEVYKIGTKPNIFAPLGVYYNSLSW